MDPPDGAELRRYYKGRCDQCSNIVERLDPGTRHEIPPRPCPRDGGAVQIIARYSSWRRPRTRQWGR